MTSCLICLKNVPDGKDYHSDCLKELFGTKTLPKLQVELPEIYKQAAEKMAGKMSISGAQEKVSLKLSKDCKNLEVASRGGQYILKPLPVRYSKIPQNEHLTMKMAELVNINIPALGLICLGENDLAYIIKRFDRLDDGKKLQVEDFCQLAVKPIKDKYNGSAELCVKILKKYATEPLIEIRIFFIRYLFCWWTRNIDMHLKNFSLIIRPDGRKCLSPAYDLLCTELELPDKDDVAMPVVGQKTKITRNKWLKFADHCGLPEGAAKRIISKQVQTYKPAIDLIDASYLSDQMKEKYKEILAKNTSILSQ